MMSDYNLCFQEAFGAFHNDLDGVRKYLKPIHIGTVEDYVDLDINKDFRKVKRTAIKMVGIHSFFEGGGGNN